MDQSQPHFTTIGQLNSTNPLRFSPDTPGMEIAIELLSSHLPGGPVLGADGKLLGFVTEFDLLKALDISRDLKTVTAREIMSPPHKLIRDDTPIKEAVRLMEENHWLNLCVEDKGIVTKTYTRHDLLRGYIGADFGIDEE